MWTQFIAPGITLVIVLGGGLIMWGILKQKVEGHGTAIAKIEANCEKTRTACTIEMCRKLDEVTDLIRDEAQKREETRKEHIQEIIDVKREVNATARETARFTGKVEEFMETVKSRFPVHMGGT